MTGKDETIYIKIDRNVLSHKPAVTINDLATITGSNEALLRQIKQLKVYQFDHPGNMAFSIMKIIQLILQKYPQLTIVNAGEMDFLVEYRSQPVSKSTQMVKLVLAWILIFIGSAFTIMAFHNDIGITSVFDKFYAQIMPGKKPTLSILEISYSIGLALGIILFYNHIGKKKITHDPTPIQVQMRKYEKDVDTTFIENAARKDQNIDAT